MDGLQMSAQQRERGYVAFWRSIQAGLSHDKHPGQSRGMGRAVLMIPLSSPLSPRPGTGNASEARSQDGMCYDTVLYLHLRRLL